MTKLRKNICCNCGTVEFLEDLKWYFYCGKYTWNKTHTIDKSDLIINKLLLIWKMLAYWGVYDKELSEEYIKTHNELILYNISIIEEYENKIEPKFIKVDNMKEFINKKN
jgi:hypothetical protein